jgi:hypothetical protein
MKIYRDTLPAKNYPSASPYFGLTQYFKKLIEEHILTRFILKAMLYPTFIKDIDTTDVVLRRRRHKTFVRIRREGSTETESSDEDSSRNSRDLERQNAIELNDSSLPDSSSNDIYGSVQYKTGKRESREWSGTVYESFVDHGEEESGAGEFQYKEFPDDRGISISSICFITDYDAGREYQDPSRESFIIGSTPKRLKDTKRESKENPEHLSTARLNLLEIKQKSEQSQASSFEHRLSGAYMACEDLANLDGSTQIRTPRNEESRQERHHSMPVQLVGNRFNNSSITEIYIPNFKDRHEPINLNREPSTPNNSFDEADGDGNKRHSSSLNLANNSTFLIPIPDGVQTEILYNMDEDFYSDKPRTLPREISPFSRHSINSDKRLSREKAAAAALDKKGDTDGHQDKQQQQFYFTNFDEKFKDYYYDPRFSSDSDSGMASITVTPDQPLVLTNRTNNSFISHRSQGNQQLFVDSGNLGSQVSDPPTDFQMAELNLNDSPVESKKNTRNQLEIIMESPSSSIDHSSGYHVEPKKMIYCTGLYCHWWKKEKLPNSMINDLLHGRDARGSGKRFLIDYFVGFCCCFSEFTKILLVNDFIGFLI